MSQLLARAVQALLGVSTRLSYRRLLAWAVACALLLVGRITEDAWLWVTIAYIGGEALERSLTARAGGAPRVLPVARPVLPAAPTGAD